MLRDYQKHTVSQLFQKLREGKKRVLVVLSCGAGKSTIFSHVCKLAEDGGRKVLFVVHRKKLVHQFKDRLQRQFDVDSGLLLSGHKEQRQHSIQVASIQTLVGRNFPDADLIIFDEAHHIKSNQFMKVVEHYKDKALVGLTATPERLDGSGLGDVFEDIINPIKMWDLIKQGFLVETKVYVPETKIDLSGVHIRAGEFIESEMYDAFNSLTAYTDVVNLYKRFADGKRMIVFNVNVKHSINMAEYFNKMGVPAAHIDGETPDDEREVILGKVESGQILVVCNVAVFIEGLDVPMIEVCCLNRATNSKTVYVQTIGRSQRPAEEKKYAIVLDFGGNTERHGFVEEYDQQEFRLEKSKEKRKKKEDTTKECPSCGQLLRLNVRMCSCGYEFKQLEEKVELSAGVVMKLLDRQAALVRSLKSMEYKRLERVSFGQLLLAEILRGYKKGWAVNQVKKRDEAWETCSWNQIVKFLESEEHRLGLTELRESVKKQIA